MESSILIHFDGIFHSKPSSYRHDYGNPHVFHMVVENKAGQYIPPKKRIDPPSYASPGQNYDVMK